MATILIVDDDATIREMLHDLLSSDLECHTADRAEQALAYLEVEDYDVVITDVSMPGLGGRDILKHIQSKHPRTPVIVISGKPDASGDDSLIAAGAFAYVTKPFQLEQIEEVVTRAIARRLDLVADSQATN
jgi:two-component system response regulator PilR (NtrC family)